MRTTVRAYGGLTTPKCLLLLIALLLFASPVSAAVTTGWTPYLNWGGPADLGGSDFSHYNTSAQFADRVVPDTTPWEIWILSGLLGLGLFLYSLRPVKSMDELEVSIVIATMASVCIGYCAFASLAIDRVVGFGVTSQIVNTSTIPPQASIYNHEYVYMENHLIYTEPTVTIMCVVFFFVIIGYTLYRASKHRAMLGVDGGDDE